MAREPEDKSKQQAAPEETLGSAVKDMINPLKMLENVLRISDEGHLSVSADGSFSGGKAEDAIGGAARNPGPEFWNNGSREDAIGNPNTAPTVYDPGFRPRQSSDDRLQGATPQPRSQPKPTQAEVTAGKSDTVGGGAAEDKLSQETAKKAYSWDDAVASAVDAKNPYDALTAVAKYFEQTGGSPEGGLPGGSGLLGFALSAGNQSGNFQQPEYQSEADATYNQDYEMLLQEANRLAARLRAGAPIEGGGTTEEPAPAEPPPLNRYDQTMQNVFDFINAGMSAFKMPDFQLLQAPEQGIMPQIETDLTLDAETLPNWESTQDRMDELRGRKS